MIDRIAVSPRIHFGKPCITVQNVLELLNEGLSFKEIIQDYYPDITAVVPYSRKGVEDIRACVGYAIALVAAEDIHLSAIVA